MNNIYDELKFRGLIAQSSNENLAQRLEKPITLYCGFDPSAESLHVGNLMPVIMLKRFQDYGHKVIVLVGGSTGLIGDPRMSGERVLNTKETVDGYLKGIRKQLSQFLDPEKTIFVNNYDWTKDISILDFLRDYGKFFNINYLLNKETIKSRLDTGISFTEFTYTMLQALDFKYLYEKYNCQLQIGGNDQWGNLTSGLELIHKSLGHESEVYALTNPLVTKSDGTKFGKSEGGAIWIDKDKTSPYEFYQFFMNSSDEDVIKYLKYLTFLNENEIEELENSLKKEPHLRNAQKQLAKQLTIFVHSLEVYETVVKVSEALFSGDLNILTTEEIEQNFISIEKFEVESNISVVDLLIKCNLANSKRESREFISNNAISINSNKISNLEHVVTEKDAIGGKYILVKRGKKKFGFVCLV